MSALRKPIETKLIGAAILVVFTVATSVLSFPGELDLSFGTNGVVTDGIGYRSFPRRMVSLPTRMTLVIGYYEVPTILPSGIQKRLLIRQYTGTGELHRTYGSGINGEAYAAAMQADGKLMVLGEAPNTIQNGVFGPLATTSPAVWRFKSDGTLDRGFGTNGVVVIDQMATNAVSTNEIGVSNGQAFISYASRSTSHDVYRFRVSRLSEAGAIDFTVTPPFLFDTSDPGVVMQLTERGQIYVAGQNQTTQNSVIRRYTRDGAVASMGLNGEAVIPDCGNPEVRPKDLVIQPDGKLLVLRIDGIQGPLTITRQNGTGANDQVFQCIGYPNMPAAVGKEISLQPDGKFFFTWGFTNGSLRFNPDGSFNEPIAVTSGTSTVQDDQKFVKVRAVYPAYTSLEIERRFLD